MKATILTAIRREFAKRLSIVPTAKWTREEVLQVYDQVIAEQTEKEIEELEEELRSRAGMDNAFFAAVVNLFWLHTFCSDTEANTTKALQDYHYLTMRQVYQRFVEWSKTTKFKEASLPSEKRFCGQHGLFLQVAGEYFSYSKMKDGRRIILRDARLLKSS